MDAHVDDTETEAIGPAVGFRMVRADVSPISQTATRLPTNYRPTDDPTEGNEATEPVARKTYRLNDAADAITTATEVTPDAQKALGNYFVSAPVPGLSREDPRVAVPRVDII